MRILTKIKFIQNMTNCLDARISSSILTLLLSQVLDVGDYLAEVQDQNFIKQ